MVIAENFRVTSLLIELRRLTILFLSINFKAVCERQVHIWGQNRLTCVLRE